MSRKIILKQISGKWVIRMWTALNWYGQGQTAGIRCSELLQFHNGRKFLHQLTGTARELHFLLSSTFIPYSFLYFIIMRYHFQRLFFFVKFYTEQAEYYSDRVFNFHSRFTKFKYQPVTTMSMASIVFLSLLQKILELCRDSLLSCPFWYILLVHMPLQCYTVSLFENLGRFLLHSPKLE